VNVMKTGAEAMAVEAFAGEDAHPWGPCAAAPDARVARVAAADDDDDDVGNVSAVGAPGAARHGAVALAVGVAAADGLWLL